MQDRLCGARGRQFAASMRVIAMIIECEIKRDSHWSIIGIDEALKESKGEAMRCTACHGRLHARKMHMDGTAAHFEHKIAHSGCKLMGYHRSPPATLHQAPLK